MIVLSNRVKNMRATEKMLLEAAEKSSLLVVDKVGSRIAPKESPFDQEDDSIERTLYLENYNRSHDHDSLRKELSKYGKIQLVSMPRFKQSKKFKGFAFIEFGTKEAASNAMKEIQMQSQVADGMKVMTKKRWVEIKEALKKELYDDSIVSKNHDEKGNKKKRKRSDIDVFSSSAAHIHFATSSEEEDSTK
jgi:La-related protein 7